MVSDIRRYLIGAFVIRESSYLELVFEIPYFRKPPHEVQLRTCKLERLVAQT